MKQEKKWGFLLYGIVVSLVLSIVLAYDLLLGDHSYYLPGDSTHGHYQIELQCDACHTQSFSDGKSMQQACVSCHAIALDIARDTHPKKKFTDPRNADLMKNLDATQCVTCHVEHSLEITDELGVTLPQDFCFYCHEGIAEDRPSHADFKFDTCSNSGCHSYHDNRALYEKFLRKHIDKPNNLPDAKNHIPNALTLWKKTNTNSPVLNKMDHDGAAFFRIKSGIKSDVNNIKSNTQNDELISQWSQSAHAITGVNCQDCHLNQDQQNRRGIDLSVNACEECHSPQIKGFKEGLHGMRLSLNLTPMRVKDARLPMQSDAAHQTLSCSSCHDPHQPDLAAASVDACLSCHNDEHSTNYKASSHAALFDKEMSGEAEPSTGVSCATCHMPRVKKGKLVFVEHNQSLTLKPNSKMLRPVCQNCHGLEYSIAALADKALIRTNFKGAFEPEHHSFKMVRKRIQERKQKRQQ